ncbi:hypothetical protein Zmor_017899 [Zophobas morio]|uniref:Uncharacterized protein n=1 Tax=Zophobas morio TaxID=2755281 RepID=A0AA38IA42_9CUCU|nr:hypothetical protein Zmor_017899 [Zophobas morio]
MEAKKILGKLYNLETAILTVVWEELLERINKVSKKLQEPGLDLCKGLALTTLLEIFINYELRAKEFSSKVGENYSNAKHRIKIYKYSDGTGISPLQCREKFLVEVLNRLFNNRTHQKKRYFSYLEESHCVTCYRSRTIKPVIVSSAFQFFWIMKKNSLFLILVFFTTISVWSRETHLLIQNFSTQDIITTVVTDLECFDFEKGNGPLERFQNVSIPSKSSLARQLEVNLIAKNCPFTMTLWFSDLTNDRFRINQKYAINKATADFLSGGNRIIEYMRSRNTIVVTVKD